MEKELVELTDALRKAWSVETCFPRARRFWKPELPEVGHCSVTSLVVNEVLGGKIVFNDENYHFWNILPDGTEVDLTIKQFEDVPEGTFMKVDKEVAPEEMLADFDLQMRYSILRSELGME